MNKGLCFPIYRVSVCLCMLITLLVSGPPCPSQRPEVGRLTHTLGYMGTTLSQTCLRSPPYPLGLSGCVFPDSHPPYRGWENRDPLCEHRLPDSRGQRSTPAVTSPHCCIIVLIKGWRNADVHSSGRLIRERQYCKSTNKHVKTSWRNIQM